MATINDINYKKALDRHHLTIAIQFEPEEIGQFFVLSTSYRIIEDRNTVLVDSGWGDVQGFEAKPEGHIYHGEPFIQEPPSHRPPPFQRRILYSAALRRIDGLRTEEFPFR